MHNVCHSVLNARVQFKGRLMLSSYTILQYLDFLLYFVLASDWNAPFFPHVSIEEQRMSA